MHGWWVDGLGVGGLGEFRLRMGVDVEVLWYLSGLVGGAGGAGLVESGLYGGCGVGGR